MFESALKALSQWNHRRLAKRRGVHVDPVPASSDNRYTILTTEHCRYVARLLKEALESHGKQVSIITEPPRTGFDNHLHFVICAQMFRRLPASYVAFQMEQTVNPRWFNKKYLKILKRAHAVLDYSMKNIEFLIEHGLPMREVYYVPLDLPLNDVRRGPPRLDSESKYEVVFYGDAKNERRQRYLNALSARFNVKIISNVFGDALYDELRRARCVVNVHYYEGALLETTRIYECLSLGLKVVSELASDMDEHARLKKDVAFVPIDDIDAMLAAVQCVLDTDELPVTQAPEPQAEPGTEVISGNQFSFFFNRFLLANGLIQFDDFYRAASREVELSGKEICLGLPEEYRRKASFQEDNPGRFAYFPGLRHHIGWVGCGLSYKFLARRALDLGLDRLTVCEDDVEFSEDFLQRYQQARLKGLTVDPATDLFAGLISDLDPSVTVRESHTVEDVQWLVIDKMMGAVFNLYRPGALDWLARWDETGRDFKTDTIDRYINAKPGLRVVTTIPFLVGHKSDGPSTIWGNRQMSYGDMIRRSEKQLVELARQTHQPSQSESREPKVRLES